jgi:hypothetical protein
VKTIPPPIRQETVRILTHAEQAAVLGGYRKRPCPTNSLTTEHANIVK